MADDVQVKFGAQIEGLVAGVNEAKEAIAGITEPLAEVKEAFGSMTEALAATFAVDKLEEFMGKFAEMGESISRTAAITGIATNQVQLFNLAVKMSGGDADTAAMTLNILQKNIGDAISGAGTARTAFQNMGISLQQLKSTDVVDLLFQIKERMDEAGTSAEQSALKQDYLRTVAGRGAAGFLALKMSLEEVKKVAQETGVIMDPTMVGQADHLAESTKKLSSAGTGLANNLASTLSPLYDHILQQTTHLIEATNAWFTVLNAPAKGSSSLGGVLAGLGKLNMHADGGGASGSWGPSGVDLGEGEFGPKKDKPLPPLDKKAGAGADDGDSDKTEEQIDRSNYQTSLEIEKLKLQNKKDSDEAAVQSGQISGAQQIADLQTFAADEYAIQLKAVDQLASTYDQDSAEYAALQNKKLVLAQEYQNEIAKLNEKAAAEQKKQYEAELAPWKSLMEDMGGAFNTMIDGILSGQQTWKQALAKSYDDLAIKFAEIMAKMTAEYLAFEATSGKGLLGFGTSNPFAALGGGASAAAGGAGGSAANSATQALTTAITGNTASTAQNTTGILQQFESMLQSVAETLGLTTATTASTTATTANATASAANATAAGAQVTAISAGLIPAITANTFALNANTWSKTLPSYDVGSWNIASDQVASIHQGEMIIPAGPAAAIRKGTASLGGSGSASGPQGNFNITIQAIDTQTGAQFLKSNMPIIVAGMATAMRNNSNSLRAAAAS